MSNHNAAYLANVIGKTEHWVKRHARTMPHHRVGQTIFWTDEDIADILAASRVRPAGEPDGTLRPATGRRRAS